VERRIDSAKRSDDVEPADIAPTGFAPVALGDRASHPLRSGIGQERRAQQRGGGCRVDVPARERNEVQRAGDDRYRWQRLAQRNAIWPRRVRL
jgi:hypothetical protein